MDKTEKELADILSCAAFVFGVSVRPISEAVQNDDDLDLNLYIRPVYRSLVQRPKIEAHEKYVDQLRRSAEMPNARSRVVEPEIPDIGSDELDQYISYLDSLTRNSANVPVLKEVSQLTSDPFCQKVALRFAAELRSVFFPQDPDGSERRWHELAAAWSLDAEEAVKWYDEIAEPALRNQQDEISKHESDKLVASVYGLTSSSFGDRIEYRDLFIAAFLGEYHVFREAWARLDPVDPNIQHEGVPLVDWAARGDQKDTVNFLAAKGAVSAGKSDLPAENFVSDFVKSVR